MLPNNIFLVRIIGSNKAQVLHRMQLHQFTPRQLLLGIRITPQEWKPNPDVSIRHDNLDARTWEREYRRPLSDAANDNATPPNSPEIAVQSDLSFDETSNTPGTARESSQEIFPKSNRYKSIHGT